MSTGTIQTKQKTLSPFIQPGLLALNFVVKAGENDLKEGQEVFVSGDNEVSERDGGTEYPIGVLKQDAIAGEDVSVEVALSRDMKAIGSGVLAAGAFVKPTGVVNADGLPQYVAVAAALDFVSAIVLVGAGDAEEIRIGILKAPFQNAAS